MTRIKEFKKCDGAVPPNPYWGLSGISPDGRTVAVSIWRDGLVGRAGYMVYDQVDWGDWHDGPGRRAFFRHLAWARDNCGGIVMIVLSVRKPWTASGRVQAFECYAQPNLIMRIVHLDPEVGAFRLEQVIPAVAAAA